VLGVIAPAKEMNERSAVGVTTGGTGPRLHAVVQETASTWWW